MNILEYIRKKLFYFKLKKGKQFSKRDKRILLRAVELSKKEITETPEGTDCRGICTTLESNCIKITGTGEIYSKLRESYHSPKYYRSKGLPVKHEIAYWWDRDDRKSRLKALDILREAIIND